MELKSLQVEGLGKRYWIPKAQGKPAAGASRFDRIRSFLTIPLARELGAGTELWALKDVSFDVDHGSVLGIIGSNGAGKTTLLKVIAKVIAPTEGRVRGRGRVVSLLELGAGFDDEATARENVYMNAAMNGVPRADAARRLDDIIAFAELGDFVDTPLQYYSSGMYLRLAFSVAINMDPAILLADEILAVGDIAFQERCLTKVRELARDRGLTVLFVSHDMEAISRICDRVIWLKGGRIHADGRPAEVVADYQNAAWEQMSATATPDVKPQADHVGRYGEILDVKLLSADGREIGSPPRNEDVFVRIRFRTLRARSHVRCAFELYSKGVLVLRSAQPELTFVRRDKPYEALARIPANLLAETSYTITATVTLVRGETDEYDLVLNKAVAFLVYGEQGVESGAKLQRKGVVDPTLEWSWSLESEQHAIRV